MKLFEMAKKFGDGFKEGWNECQSKDKTQWLENNYSEETNTDELPLQDSLFPEYDDIHDIGHQSAYPHHPWHN